MYVQYTCVHVRVSIAKCGCIYDGHVCISVIKLLFCQGRIKSLQSVIGHGKLVNSKVLDMDSNFTVKAMLMSF